MELQKVGKITEERYKLEQGDCLELMRDIPNKYIDMILCDPPYGTTHCKWDSVIRFDLMWEQINRIIKPHGAICIFGTEPFSSTLRISNLKNYKYDWTWDKAATTGFLNAKKRPLKQIEQISVFSIETPIYFPQMEVRGKERIKGGHKNPGDASVDIVYGIYENPVSRNNVYYPTNLLKFSNAKRTGKVHPTQKPVPLLEYLIKTYTRENDVVLDFTMGSGSTGVACINVNRKFYGIELDQKYFDIANKRIEGAIIDKSVG